MAASAKIWLRLEGLAVLALAVFLYAQFGRGWVLFALLFFAPDVSIAGYAAGPRIGAAAYNLFHSYALPLALAGAGLAAGASLPVALALVWTAHVGFDRMLGYGLKLPGGFRETHLGPIGRGAGREADLSRA